MKHSNAESCAGVVWQVWIARFQFFLWQIFRHQHPYSDQILSWQVPVAWQTVPADRICTVTAQLSDNCWLEHLEGDKVLRIMTAPRAISLPHLMNFLAKGLLCSSWTHGFRSDCIKMFLAKQSSHVYISFGNWRFTMPWSQMQVSISIRSHTGSSCYFWGRYATNSGQGNENAFQVDISLPRV